jgi:hypothetical protein
MLSCQQLVAVAVCDVESEGLNTESLVRVLSFMASLEQLERVVAVTIPGVSDVPRSRSSSCLITSFPSSSSHGQGLA